LELIDFSRGLTIPVFDPYWIFIAKPSKMLGLCSKVLKQLSIIKGVHGLPKVTMVDSFKFALAGQTLQWLLLPKCGISFDPIDHVRFQHKESSIDSAPLIILALILKYVHGIRI
jgi:hypothetical protein